MAGRERLESEYLDVAVDAMLAAMEEGSTR
jgi:hypothetical protein